MAFQYKTVFFPIEYAERWNQFDETLPPKLAKIESILGNEKYETMMNKMGEQGWELVSVQTVLRGEYNYDSIREGGYGYGYSLTDGFMFFWKKLKEKETTKTVAPSLREEAQRDFDER
jgi:hypothetical protein